MKWLPEVTSGSRSLPVVPVTFPGANYFPQIFQNLYLISSTDESNLQTGPLTMAILGSCCRSMQVVIPSRANFKRILYWCFVWTALCYLVLQITNKQSAVTYLSGHVQRGLLQKAVVTEQNGLPVGEGNRWTVAQKMAFPLDDEPDIHVDRTPEIEENQLLAQLANLTNLPQEYWSMDTKQRATLSTVTTCARFPNLYDIEFNNMYWQKMTTRNNTSFYLYRAFYDDRWRGGPTAQIRILGMVDRVKPPTTYCQIWFSPKKDKDGNWMKTPLMGQVAYTYGWVRQWGNYKDGILQPFLVSCRVPTNEAAGRVPVAVSLVERQCDKQTSILRVVYDKPFADANVSSLYPAPPAEAKSWVNRNHTFYKTISSPPGDADVAKRGHFAVCVKGLDFLHEDLSVRLVEWLEMLRILGAEKVFLYELEVHPNISKVLKYYEGEGLVHTTPITLPGTQPNIPGLRHLYLKAKLTAKRQNEVIPYNDCLYRNLYRYEYLALLDIDEIIMPKRHEVWRDMMEDVVKAAMGVRNYTRASYNFRNVYFLDDLQDGNELAHEAHEVGIPKHLHMLQHVYRSRNYTKPGSYVKCFHNTDRAVWLHNHFPLSCLGTCTTWSVDPELAHMQHYRKDCVGPLKKLCSKDFRAFTTRDTTIWKYKDDLVRSTNAVLGRLGFFG